MIGNNGLRATWIQSGDDAPRLCLSVSAEPGPDEWSPPVATRLVVLSTRYHHALCALEGSLACYVAPRRTRSPHRGPLDATERDYSGAWALAPGGGLSRVARCPR